MVAHAFILSTIEAGAGVEAKAGAGTEAEAEVGVSLSLRPVWSKKKLPRQLRLHRETLTQNPKITAIQNYVLER